MTEIRIVQADIVGSIFFAMTAAFAVLTEKVRGLALAWALILFVAGCVAFLAAFAKAVSRSRTDAIGIGGLYFLAGDDTVEDRRNARILQGLFAAQIVVALATAAAKPFTSLAFGILVPVYGLGLMGLYGAHFGRFGARSTP